MANRKKEDPGKRINLHLPTDDYEAVNNVAVKRKQSISEFIRRAVDFQAWLETIMPEVEGFGADELAKISLARKQLADLEERQRELMSEDNLEGNDDQASDAHQDTAVPRTKKWPSLASKTSNPASH